MKKSSRQKRNQEELLCAICFKNLLKKDYATVDHIADATTKCCPNCLKKWYKINNISLIARVPVCSYSIYNSSGKCYQKVPLDKAMKIKQYQRRGFSMHDLVTLYQTIIASLIWLFCCVFMILFCYWYDGSTDNIFDFMNTPVSNLFIKKV